MSNPCNLGPQVMPLFPIKDWVAVNRCVQVAAEDMLDETGLLDLLGSDLRELDPVLEDAVGDPVHELIGAHASGLYLRVLGFLLCLFKHSLHDQVVSLLSVNLAPEPQLSSP